MFNGTASTSFMSLEDVTIAQLKKLVITLWGQGGCDCSNGLDSVCSLEGCPSHRLTRFGRFHQFYKELCVTYEPDLSPWTDPALGTHEDLFGIIRALKSDPSATRSQLITKMFHDRDGNRRDPTPEDQERALNIAVRVMTMVSCSAEHQALSTLEYGDNLRPWTNISFGSFITDAFPVTDHPSLNDDDARATEDVRGAISAKKLKKILRVRFQPTDDIRSHLKLDAKRSIVQIYHHTAFLKEQLRITKDKPADFSTIDCLKLGVLPRKLVLEILDSIQKVLFPLSDSKSRSLLQSLILKSGFDPDCLRFESTAIRNPHEKDIPYEYLGARMMYLYEEMQHPKPKGNLEKWLEKKSGARYVMLATLIGVLIAIMLGLAGLAIAGYQSWVAYQAWKHPVTG